MGMLTAVVIQAGIGDLSLGLQMAGFRVLEAYETDKRKAALHEANIDASVQVISPENLNLNSVAEADLLAAHIYLFPTGKNRGSKADEREQFLPLLHDLLKEKRPEAFFFTVNIRAIKDVRLQNFCSEVIRLRYRMMIQTVDVARATGFPVREQMACLVGLREAFGEGFKFPAFDIEKTIPTEQFLQREEVDPWYSRIKLTLSQLSEYEEGQAFLCWSGKSYKGTDTVSWNYRNIPLCSRRGDPRKITHREVARLKGFPEDYGLRGDRSRLYQSLMFANNVQVVKQIAGALYAALRDPEMPKNRSVERAKQFESLFKEYLSEAAEKMRGKPVELSPDDPCDISFQSKESTLYFELKLFSGRAALPAKIDTVCRRLALDTRLGEHILVIANRVEDSTKERCRKECDIEIWDIENLLWLFKDNERLLTEFIALLDYSVEFIRPVPPKRFLSRKPTEATVRQPKAEGDAGEKSGREPDWREKLRSIRPGREQFRDFEDVCTEILKYVLGDYLTMWEKQSATSDAMYRFDLCCKIKSDTSHDFFETLKHFFNTKYIVFEFKNYQEQIGQKEIYTTEKYLYQRALRGVAIILSHAGANERAKQAAKGSLRESGKLILCLSENHLLKMIENKEKEEEDEPADVLADILDDMLVHLDK